MGISITLNPSILTSVGRNLCAPLKNFTPATHSRRKARKQQPASEIVSPETLLRTQLAMRDDAVRIQESPAARAWTREPHTQSAALMASRNRGISEGGFCKSASRVTIKPPRAERMPAHRAADCPDCDS